MRRGRYAARVRSTSAQSPTFAKRGRITDLDRDVIATGVQFLPERIGSVELKRIAILAVRGEHVPRFARREDMTADIGFLAWMVSRPKNFLEHFVPILHRLIVNFDDDMFNNCRSDAFVGEGELDRSVAGVEFENRPDSCAHLLALHVGGITGNAQRQKSNQRRDDRIISARAATPCRIFLRHATDRI